MKKRPRADRDLFLKLLFVRLSVKQSSHATRESVMMVMVDGGLKYRHSVVALYQKGRINAT